MKRGVFLFILLLFFPGAGYAQTVAAEYALAQKCYHSLDKSVPREWEKCINQFQDVVVRYPQSKLSIKALFNVGRLSQEKYERTRSPDDLEATFKAYNSFIKTYPKDSMADDALYRIGVYRYEEENNIVRAKRAFRTLVDRYPYGDMAVPASQYLQKLLKEDGGERIVVAETVPKKPVITAPAGAPESTPVAKPEVKKSVEETIEEVPVLAQVSPLQKMEEYRIRRVVIDPGHGGQDTGAVGSGGTKEEVVALQIARKLAFKLKHHLGLDVLLTRTNHGAVSLEDRNAIADRVGADLFISIHANANDSEKVSGVQTFFLNNATSEAAKRLAKRENKELGKPQTLPEKILSMMLQNANTDESRELAALVHTDLIKRLRKAYNQVRDLNVDSALFYVLVGAKCPSILVETSFISHPREEKRLKDSEYQWTVAEGIAKGVQRYIEKRDKLAFSSSL